MHRVTRQLIDRAPARIRPGVELVLRTVDDSIDDRVPGLAAEVAFYVILSLPPLLLTVVGTAAFLESGLKQDLRDRVVELAGNVLRPSTVDDVIRPVVEQLVRVERGDIVTLGFLLTIYSASRAVKVVLEAITIAYDLEETRPGWQQRLWGLGLTVLGIVLGLVIVPVIVVGPRLGSRIADVVGLPSGVGSLLEVLYWPVAGLLAMLAIASLYHFGAPWWTPWRRDLPGAALAMVVWLVGGAGLRLYTARTFTDASLYDPIAGPLVLLLWLYVTAFGVLLGAEFNAEIERMWPTQHKDQPAVREAERLADPDRVSAE